MGNRQRVEQVDFMKCVCIILMVMFHLAYFSEYYPTAKQFVYAFHMPVFLFFSGYFLNTAKSPKAFFSSTLKILIPYMVMELLYVLCASFMPTRDAVTLSPALILDKLFLHPIGPYWYLHTILLSSSICFGVTYLLTYLLTYLHAQTQRSYDLSSYVPFAAVVVLVCFAISTKLLSITNVCYYAIGFVLSYSQVDFEKFLRPSIFLSLILILSLCLGLGIEHISYRGMSNVLFVYAMMSFMMGLYPLLPRKIKECSLALGRNTLSILLFSPIFTMASKWFIPYLKFDPTRLCFMLLGTTISLMGSLLIGKVLRRIRALIFSAKS